MRSNASGAKLIERTGDIHALAMQHRAKPGTSTRSHEHRWQEPGQLGGSDSMCRFRIHVDRRLGCQHRDAHSRRSSVRYAAYSANRSSVAALRRQSYDLNADESLFNVEYADILGIPVRLHREAGHFAPPSQAARDHSRQGSAAGSRCAGNSSSHASRGIASNCPTERLEASVQPDDSMSSTLTPQIWSARRSNSRIKALLVKAVDLTI